MVVQIKVFHDGEFTIQLLIITNSRFVLPLCIAKGAIQTDVEECILQHEQMDKTPPAAR